ncbi:OsmC family protein [Galactobacter caseinivorans]|uniref:OsmC family peroxiredoxin n=1 Tax=Galactobacter caseinivorans TaxID=2676123 RepID=A0A496PGZ3_9MICC|nr:OsmC family protein [Galactobacter caseinivorans]RKW69755.1 OsmC family peroxiredoxin [Galactobacter caseinivorans]
MSTDSPGPQPSHGFDVQVAWDGPGEHPTDNVRRFPRGATAAAEPAAAGVPALRVSAARTFFGDRDAWNPETLLLTALAQCHLSAFLRQAGLHGFRVTSATVRAHGELTVDADGAGRLVRAALTPHTRFESDPTQEQLRGLHEEAHRQCFIANSVAFPVSVLEQEQGH